MYYFFKRKNASFLTFHQLPLPSTNLHLHKGQKLQRCPLFSHQNLLFHDKRLLFGNKRLRTSNRSLLIFVRSLLIFVRSLLLTDRSLLFLVQKVQKVQPVFVCYIVICVCNYMTDVQRDTNLLLSC